MTETVGIVAYSPADQVVTVRAQSRLRDLDAELAAHGQCIPLGNEVLGMFPDDLASLIGFNFPHTLEAQCGSWRDWVLGMTLQMADGTVVHSGSRVVKSVAGYDLHKLVVGARGTLATIVDVTLRTLPRSALPTTQAEILGEPDGEWRVAQRVLRSDFPAFCAAAGPTLWAKDPASCTGWLTAPQGILGYEGWTVSVATLAVEETTARYMRRAKELFDPEGRLEALP